MAAKSQTVEDVDVVVVGAGFAGMYLLVRLRAAGMTAVAVEAGGGVAEPRLAGTAIGLGTCDGTAAPAGATE